MSEVEKLAKAVLWLTIALVLAVTVGMVAMMATAPAAGWGWMGGMMGGWSPGMMMFGGLMMTLPLVVIVLLVFLLVRFIGTRESSPPTE